MASAITTSLIKTFLQQHFDDIITAIADTGLYFPSTVAQLSVESRNGTSELAVKYNNYGGIKGNASNGVLLNTTEGDNGTPSQDYFRVFSSFKDFMDYYVSNLVDNERYVNGGILQATSPEDQILKMAEAGYTTMTPSVYLKKTGIQDRINATRENIPIGKITASDAATLVAQNSPTMTLDQILGLNNLGG